jgi:hypothetical protein
MGIQINSQPQNFKSYVVIGDGVSAVDGVTVYGSLSASSSLRSPSVSANNITALAGGKFYGDGSGLTNINAGNIQGFSGVTSINTLTGDVSNVVFTTSANTFSNTNTFSQTTNFAAITATTGNFSGNLSSSGNILSAGQDLTGIFGSKANTDSVFSTVQSITGTGLSTGNLTATNGSFTSLTATNYLSAGQNLTGIFGSKANTDSVFSTVQSITGTGLNTGNLTATNGSFTSLTATNYLSAGQNLANIFGSKTNADSVYTNVNTNSSNWDTGYNISRALSTGPSFDNSKGFRFVSNNPTVYGDLTIYGTLNALSGATFTNTTFTTTSSLCVVNRMNVDQAALYIGASGSGDIASFYDIDANVEVLHVGGSTGSFPGVGIRTSSPTKTLTVSGDLSASGEIYANKYFLAGVDISSTTSTVSANSANWSQAYTALTPNSSNWTQAYTNLTSNSANYNSVTSNSANWNTAYRQISSGSLSAAGVGFTVGVSLSTPALTAGTATFSTSVSSPAVSGTHFGSGANLTALNASNISSGTLSNSLLPAIATFSTSVSSPAVSGTHYGNGANLTGVVASTLPAAGTFTTSVSSPSISGVNMYGNLVAPVATQTATFTLALANAGGVIRIAPSTNTTVYVNVPTNASVAFPIGTQTIFAQVSAATVTVSAAAGVTLLSYQSKTSLAALNSVASLIKTGTNEWLLAGDIN